MYFKRYGQKFHIEIFTGHLQILDSAYESVQKKLGYHCGEAEQPKQLIR